MKNTKKFAAMIAALALSTCSIAPLAMGMTASAAGTTSFELEVPDDLGIKDDKVYAYQLFKLKFDASEMVTEIDWADDIDNNVKSAIKTAVGVNSDNAADVATKITEKNSETVARAVANELTAITGIEGKYADDNVTFDNELENGYYLFTCTGTKKVLGEVQTSVSLGMLTIANGAATTNTVGNGIAKIGLPTVEKKVLEDDNQAQSAATYEQDMEWNDVADLEIGQEAQFGLYGTLPENYADYETYYYEFVDTLDGVFKEPTDFTVTASNSATLEKGVDYTLAVNKNTTTGNWDVSVKFANLKTNKNVDEDTVITVKYKTALTDAAKVCSVNPNEVSLKYSNNPNNSGDGENSPTGETPKDKVGVYTYDFQFEKKFINAGSDLTEEEIKAGDYSKLTFGVTDKKFREVTENDGDLYGKYDYVIDENGSEDLKLKLIDAEGNLVTEDITEETDVAGYKLVVRIKGLDSDEYVITEDNTNWTDYNALKSGEGKFEIVTNLVQKQDETAFNNVEETYSKNDDNYFEIQNKKGTSLPTTGGMGTTLFYLGGGAMVAVAGVFLITKKRAGKSEN